VELMQEQKWQCQLLSVDLMESEVNSFASKRYSRPIGMGGTIRLVDYPSLCEAWIQGFDSDDELILTEVADRAFTPEELQAITEQINEANTSAMKGCGLSDVLYEKQLQSSYERILSAAPACLEKATKMLLMEHGYDPEFEPYQAQEGECRLTGIDIDHCPCGRHP
jgi:hypothetical protein